MFRRLPTVARVYESHDICENWVAFVNVKSTYRIDEDVVVDYTLQNEVNKTKFVLYPIEVSIRFIKFTVFEHFLLSGAFSVYRLRWL